MNFWEKKFEKNDRKIHNEGKIAVILSINTLVGGGKTILVILGHFLSFLAISAILGASLGLLGPFLMLLGPSVGFNVCIKCFL